jgi:drug/metabolite transporter (DMT)-like permease
MKMRAFLQLHIAVFLFGFTAILGDVIRLPVVSLVWWRVLLSIILLLVLIGPTRIYRTMNRQFLMRHVFVGLLIAIHWLAFYGSIKVANASIALVAMSTQSFFTALIEPLIIRRLKWKSFDLVVSVLVIPAMMLIFYSADQVQQEGLWLGLIAAVLGAVFSIFNKLWIVDGKELEITFVQQGTVTLGLGVLMLFSWLYVGQSFEFPVGIDWLYMFVFAALCTVLAYYLYLRAMHWLSAFDVNFAFNMEPVYGLIMAAILLRDYQEISTRIYLGMFFILLMVFLHTAMKSRNRIKWLLKRINIAL